MQVLWVVVIGTAIIYTHVGTGMLYIIPQHKAHCDAVGKARLIVLDMTMWDASLLL